MQLIKLVVPVLVAAGFATTAHAQAPGLTQPVGLAPAYALSAPDASAATAAPDPNLPDPANGPHAGAWSVSLGLPYDFSFGPSGARVGVAGFSLGVGKRVTDDWYLGGTGEVDLVLGTGEGDDGAHTLLRGGAEARYIFNRGVGSASVNCGPAFPVLRTDWIGLRAGAESVDTASPGGFAELSLGTDFWFSTTQFSVYVAGGLSIQRTSVYPTTTPSVDNFVAPTQTPAAPSDPSSLDASPYVAFGFRFAFG